MSSYAAADGFGTLSTGLVMVDPTSKQSYQIGFGPAGPDGLPTVKWVVLSTWGHAKTLLGPTWATAKRNKITWGQAKAIVAS